MKPVYILAAILIFGVLIAVHELGHFVAAKLCGVKVNEFSENDLPCRPVCLQDVLQGRLPYHGNRCPGLGYQAGDVVETDFVLQEQPNRLLIGAVQNGASGAALGSGLLRHSQTRERLPVRRREGQWRAGQKVQRLRRAKC